MTNLVGHDAYSPAEISKRVEAVGVSKARLSTIQTATLAILAGLFIGFGGALFTMVMTGVDASFGPARFLGGVVFSLGLILVIVGGAELFTGNALMVMAAVDRKITIAELSRNWVIVYVGNFAGALILALAIFLAGTLSDGMGETAKLVALGKVSLDPLETFVRGILCNVLVCLAVWLSLAARTVSGKILSIIWPISGFVALGFEHSVANMYLIPQGMFAGANIGAAAFVQNLFLVTAGNIIGGAGGVALTYRLAYGSAQTD